MVNIILVLILFFQAVLTHIAFCRMQKKECLQIFPFFYIAAFFLSVYIMACPFILTAQSNNPGTFWNIPLPLTSIFLYVLLIPVYLIFYFGTSVESPSRRILIKVEDKGAVTYEELEGHVTNDNMIRPRLNDLEEYHYIQRKEDKIILSAAGKQTGRFLSIYQKISGRKSGG